MAGLRLRKPGAGREPAASALLGWLTDERSPHLCVLTGPAGVGKSHLLAWLVEYGASSADTTNRRVHAVAPLAGTGLRGAAWLLADHLGLAARAPAELIAAIERDGRHTVLVLCDLHLSHAPEAVLEQLVRPLQQLGHVKLVIESRTGAPCTEQLFEQTRNSAVMDLMDSRWTTPEGFSRWALTTDPAADAERCYPLPGPVVRSAQVTDTSLSLDSFALAAETMVRADPHAVTAWLDHHAGTAGREGDLGRAWLRAGQSLCVSDTASARALTLLAALDSDTAADTRHVLHGLVQSEPWHVAHTSTREGASGHWPGPATALCAGTALYARQVLCAGHLGDVRLLDPLNGRAAGRLTSPPQPSGRSGLLPPRRDGRHGR
ncbi:ATP-binding protein [Streptomyces sp. Ju416(a)]|uniref:ATP-binding protein n=1 Tax=Streptomyces sp. Ju416(a) TaxID=3446591 RepID=UPI00403D9DCD